MAEDRDDLVGLPAYELAALVQRRAVTCTRVLEAHLARIAAFDAKVGAFQTVRAAGALVEAQALDDRDDLSELPLAGVPVAIKDNVDVEGEPTRHGSLATDPAPRPADHELVRRVRAAGAIVIGKTRVPELCAWPWTDGGFGVTRSPWDLTCTAGGSSGGSAAAVAAGMVPLAHGSDGGGSVRIPAAACGLFGIKPGYGVVPGVPGHTGWNGLSANGALATTVADAALLLAAMAARADLAHVAGLDRTLRVAVSVLPQIPSGVDPAYAGAASGLAAALAEWGHEVVRADPDYAPSPMATAGVRAIAGIAEEAAGLRISRLERRSRPLVLTGRALRRAGLLRDEARVRFRRSCEEFFADYDVLLTPTIAGFPVAAEGWARRGWVANTRAATYGAFTGAWNVAGFPAVAVPAGRHSSGFPLSIQLVAPEGGEALLLSLAQQIEERRSWQRHPGASSAPGEQTSGRMVAAAVSLH
jgi:amidase